MDWDKYGRIIAKSVLTSPILAIMIYCGSKTSWLGTI